MCKKIFISYIHEDEECALNLKYAFEKTYKNKTDVFVAGKSINPGEDWKDRILKELSLCDILLAICSEISINRPWINFEIGYATGRKIEVIPICINGVDAKDIPLPISAKQVLRLTDLESLNKINEAVCNDICLDFECIREDNKLHTFLII